MTAAEVLMSTELARLRADNARLVVALRYARTHIKRINDTAVLPMGFHAAGELVLIQIETVLADRSEDG